MSIDACTRPRPLSRTRRPRRTSLRWSLPSRRLDGPVYGIRTDQRCLRKAPQRYRRYAAEARKLDQAHQAPDLPRGSRHPYRGAAHCSGEERGRNQLTYNRRNRVGDGCLKHATHVCGEEHVGSDGIISVSAIDLTPEYHQAFRAFVEERIKRGIAAPGESVDVVNFLPDLNQPDRFDRIALLLSQRGHRDARIEKILGGNFARLFTEVCG